jgi:hypothetical protein
MTKGLIRLCYSKTIDASASGAWEKYVFDDTYREFFMQAQYYNQQQKFSTFREILENDPKADQLHALVSTAAIGYLRQLNERIPDVTNASGKVFIPFKNFRFEIIQSHVKDKYQHKIAIHFYSEVLTWVDTVQNMFLLAIGDQHDALRKGKMIDTEMAAWRTNLGISAFQLAADVQMIETNVHAETDLKL